MKGFKIALWGRVNQGKTFPFPLNEMIRMKDEETLFNKININMELFRYYTRRMKRVESDPLRHQVARLNAMLKLDRILELYKELHEV